jgi:hypothetical protein
MLFGAAGAADEFCLGRAEFNKKVVHLDIPKIAYQKMPQPGYGSIVDK